MSSNKQMPKCPETHELQSFARFQMTDEEFNRIVEHLGSCRSCEETICNLEKQAETIGDLIRRLPPTPYVDEPECQQLMTKIRTGKLFSKEPKGSDLPNDSPSRVVRDYELLELLGQGGMGQVGGILADSAYVDGRDRWK
jgi:hypothetical protein